MAKIAAPVGNALGGARAEVDTLIDKAFVPTSDFHALVTTRDFNFIVGRRGTGKTALFLHTYKHFRTTKTGYAFKITPEEHEQLELQSVLSKISKDYRIVRAITRVAWKVSLLFETAEYLKDNFKFKSSESYPTITQIIDNHPELQGLSFTDKASQIIRQCWKNSDDPSGVAGQIARSFTINYLENSLNDALLNLKKPTYFLFDGLDEGWFPNEFNTAILGGLALCAADFLDRQHEIIVMLFIRDNIFRSLSYFDKDFTRHLEGNTIRLTWDEESLLHLVSNRLRVSLNLEKIENNVKVWNKFSSGELENKTGFRACLNYTLYRPRDIIVLLNTVYNHISRSGRETIIKDDLDYASKQISENRLADLYKEYDTVFPGLSRLIKSFANKPAFQRYNDVVEQLNEAIIENAYTSQDDSDFAVLGSGEDAFFALFSVGFIGLSMTELQDIKFCHDGSPAQWDASNENQISCVHPCYWKALHLKSETVEEKILVRIQDEEKSADPDDFKDLRTRRIGQIISELPKLNEGTKDAAQFEEWVLQVTKILFSGKLSNFELHPNKDATQRRDVVATNVAENGFWRRIRDDYKSRQVVFEVKNFSQLKSDNFRQALGYTGGPYGNFIIIVTRSTSEGLTGAERGWLQELWQKKILVFIIPATILTRYVSKLRNQRRFDYTEKQLQKRLDTFERNYLSIRPTKK